MAKALGLSAGNVRVIRHRAERRPVEGRQIAVGELGGVYGTRRASTFLLIQSLMHGGGRLGEYRYELRAHAAAVIAERGIEAVWVERVLRAPDRVHADQNDPTLTHALGRIDERGQRVLRVVYNASASPPRVVTAYFDRRQRGEP